MQSDFVALILMPVYDTPSGLLKASLESVAVQDYTNKRLLIHDDCSCEETRSIVQEFTNENKFVEVVRLKQNMGIAHARNALLQRVETQYANSKGVVICLDSDDAFETQGFVSEVCARMSETRADVCFLEFDLLYANTGKESFLIPNEVIECDTSPQFVEKHGRVNPKRLQKVREDLRALAEKIHAAPGHAIRTCKETVLSATLCWARMFSIQQFVAQNPVGESIDLEGKSYKYAFEDYLYSIPLFYDIWVTALPPGAPQRILYTVRDNSVTGAQKDEDLVVARYERLREVLEAIKDAPAEAREFARQFFDWKIDEITNVVAPDLVSRGMVSAAALEEFKEKTTLLRAKYFPE